MSGLGGSPTIGTVDLYTSNASQGNTAIGQLIYGDAGKGYRYVKAGVSALVVGNLLQGPAIDTQFDDMAVGVAGVVGDMFIKVTNGTTALTGNEFVGGTIMVSVNSASGTTLADEYTIVGNSAAISGASLKVNIDRPLRVALTTSTTKVTMRLSPYMGVLQAIASTLTSTIVGVAIYEIAAGEYGWIQTKGVGAVLADSTSILVGSQVTGTSATAGAVTLAVAGLPNVGYAMRAASSGKPLPVLLKID
jgi:hypothetical protein